MVSTLPVENNITLRAVAPIIWDIPTASLSNISRQSQRLNEEEDSRYATLPAEAMKKDSSRNIEINLNFEKGKVNLDEQLDKVTEYDMVIRSYEKDRMKWDTDRKAFKNELNYQQT